MKIITLNDKVQLVMMKESPYDKCSLFLRTLKFTDFFAFTEPTDAGIIPPQFRKPSIQGQNNPVVPATPMMTSTASNHSSSPESQSTEKRLPHQWSSNPVEEWAKEQVRPVRILEFKIF